MSTVPTWRNAELQARVSGQAGLGNRGAGPTGEELPLWEGGEQSHTSGSWRRRAAGEAFSSQLGQGPARLLPTLPSQSQDFSLRLVLE